MKQRVIKQRIVKNHITNHIPVRWTAKLILTLACACLFCFLSVTQTLANTKKPKNTNSLVDVAVATINPSFKNTNTAPHLSAIDVFYTFEYQRSDQDGTRTRTHKIDSYLTYYLTTRADLVLNIPYDYVNDDYYGRHAAFNDVTLYLYYNYFERQNWKLYAVPFFSAPTGTYGNGIGTGKFTYGMKLSASKETNKWCVEGGIQYTRNENKTDSRFNLWKLYIIPIYYLNDTISLFSEIRTEDDANKQYEHMPIYVTAGVGYHLSKPITLSLALEQGFNKPEQDTTVYLGFSWEF